jgi:secreted PhoX family phosphatase
MSNEDSTATGSQVYMYVGSKQKTGTFYQKAGFANGKHYVLSGFPGDDNQIRTLFGKNSPIPVDFTQIGYNSSGKEQNEKALEKGLRLSRVEDGHFDPNNPSDYYFITTESNKDPKATSSSPEYPGVARDGGALWRLRFEDVSNPLKGGTLEMLLDGSEDVYLSKPDNLTIDGKGNILIQEDPGSNDAVARIVAYRISDGAIGVVAKFKDQYFKKGGSEFITNDEETSGVIDVSSFLRKSKSDKATYFMFVAQVHSAPDKARMDITSDSAKADLAASIEGGQWYVMKITDWKKVYGF